MSIFRLCSPYLLKESVHHSRKKQKDQKTIQVYSSLAPTVYCRNTQNPLFQICPPTLCPTQRPKEQNKTTRIHFPKAAHHPPEEKNERKIYPTIVAQNLPTALPKNKMNQKKIIQPSLPRAFHNLPMQQRTKQEEKIKSFSSVGPRISHPPLQPKLMRCDTGRQCSAETHAQVPLTERCPQSLPSPRIDVRQKNSGNSKPRNDGPQTNDSGGGKTSHVEPSP